MEAKTRKGKLGCPYVPTALLETIEQERAAEGLTTELEDNEETGTTGFCPLKHINPEHTCLCRLRLKDPSIDTERHNLNHAYELQIELGEGEKAYGAVTERKAPPEQAAEAQLEQAHQNRLKAHPLLSQAAEFSGATPDESPVTADNPEAERDLQEKLELAYANRPHQGPSGPPTPTLKR